MIRLLTTQTIGSRLPPTIAPLCWRQERALTLGWIIYQLRPLQRRIIMYLWRPGGRMFLRNYERMVTPAPRPVGSILHETAEL